MVLSFPFGLHFVVFKPALLLVFLQLLPYVVTDELGKEKFEPESYFREKRNYATENSNYASSGVTLGFSLGRQDIHSG
jgi:hypothetical protein